MFPRLITRYGLATHLALLASLPFALFPFLSADSLAELLFWLSGLAFLWLLVEPSMRQGEHLSIARRRVLGSLVRDVAFWFFICALAVAAIRYMNSDVKLDYVNDEWIIREPSSPSLPASFGSAGLLPLAVLTGVAVVVLGIRHGIGLTGRISFGLTASFVMGLGGIAMTTCACLKVPAFMGAAKVDFLGGPFWGAFWGPGFGVWLLCALAFGAQAEARKWSAAHVPFCVALAGNASGLLFFTPPPLSTVFLVVAAIVAIFCLAYMGRMGSMGTSARGLVLMLLGFATPFFFLFVLIPPEVELDGCLRTKGNVTELVKEQVQNVYTVKAGGFLAIDKEQSETYRTLSPALSAIAKSVWKKHPWYGAGTGAFRLHVPFVASKSELQSFQRQKADWRALVISRQMRDIARPVRDKAEFNWTQLRPCNRNPVCAFNSFWTYLAEHGLLGMSLVTFGLGILLFTYVSRLVHAVIFLRGQDDADIVAFACPPIVWIVPIAFALLFALAFFAPILEIAPMMFVFAIPLAIGAASFPKKPTPAPATQKIERESP